MSDENKTRTREELTNLYLHSLARVGEKFYQMSKVKKDIEGLFGEIDALQLEASKLNDQPKAEEVPQQEEKQVVNG